MTRSRAALLYLYSNKNIAGSLLALGAVGAYFAGIIHPFWPEIVAGAYAIGALAMPGGPAIDADFDLSADPATIDASLTRFVAQVQKLVPPEVLTRIQSIVGSIRAVLPLLAKSSAVANQDSYTIRETALRYMPETVAAYLRLPPAYRNLQPLQDGKTAKQLLIDQLTLLDGKMQEIARNLLANDTQALVANGQFLRQRFEKPDFLTAV
jgi:hypothetical protein